MSGIMAKVTVEGMESLLKKLEKLPDQAKEDMRLVITEAAFEIQATARRSIQKSPADSETGRSKPGNPPKTDTGRLVNSIFVATKADGDKLEIKVGTNLAYGKHLEFGTKRNQITDDFGNSVGGSTHVAARPWLFPAMEFGKKKRAEKITTSLKKLFKKIGRTKL